MQYGNLVLVSHALCPYVQRSVVVLTEKSIAHECVYVNLAEKPDWFKAISPLGKVPLLQVDSEQVIFESAVICEFLDEITPGSLHPFDPLQKAQHRAWIEFGSQLLNDIVRLYNAESDSALQDCVQTLALKLKRLDAHVRGAFFSGGAFSMVDAAYGPIFRYFDVLDRYLPCDVFAETPHIRQWRAELARRNSVRMAVTSDYPQRLHEFLLQRRSALSQQMVAADQALDSVLVAQSARTG